MPINSVIRDKRKECGLTQEQVAKYLGVTAPAVNKWESGTSCPDIVLLAPLARLLRIDLNTLLCFSESLSEQEIQMFNQELYHVSQSKGIEAGFALARGQIQEYPNCMLLIYSAAVILEGAVAAAKLSPDKKKEFEEQILSWYERAAKEEENHEAGMASKIMLISKYVSLGKYDEAEELIGVLPERPMFDKRFLQCDLLLKKGKIKEVRKLLQRKLLQEINEVQGIFARLISMELLQENIERAERLAEIVHKAVKLFDVWEFNSIVPLIQTASARKDVERSIELLQELFSALLVPWNLQESLLYDELGEEKAEDTGTKILPLIISELENSEEYGFLHENEDFQKLFARLRRYQEKMKRTVKNEERTGK